MDKELIIFAGINGSGKSTFALDLVDDGLIQNFVNADELAKSYRELPREQANLKAGKEFLAHIDLLEKKGVSFAIETTLAGRSYLKRIRRMRDDGWVVFLYYLFIPNVELSIQRVAERVAHGGHDIPTEDIIRRYDKSLNNFLDLYRHEVDYVECILNEDDPLLIFSQDNGKIVSKNEELAKLLPKEVN